ncbi:MAG TPA: GNAT family N-acetyltransferase [Pirellulales bacterium]
MQIEYIYGRWPLQPTPASLTIRAKLCQNIDMASVLQLCRRLEARPVIHSIADIVVHSYQSDADIPAWLELRHQAFARQRIGVRQWSESDFHAEFTSRWWWQPQRMWLAESLSSDQPIKLAAQHQLVATVTLAKRGEPSDAEHARPVVHWLVVHPRWRRRGIGRLLMAHLEAAAWDAGHRELWLETHTAWEAAVKFYQSLGYAAS